MSYCSATVLTYPGNTKIVLFRMYDFSHDETGINPGKYREQSSPSWGRPVLLNIMQSSWAVLIALLIKEAELAWSVHRKSFMSRILVGCYSNKNKGNPEKSCFPSPKQHLKFFIHLWYFSR